MRRTREALFEILVREHELALLGFIRSCIHDTAAAEDIVQEAFMVAWRRLDEYDERRPFANWVRGIAKNKIIESFRKTSAQRQHIVTMSAEQIEAIAEEFDAILPGRGEAMSETLAALEMCLSRLPASQREVVDRMYKERQSCRAIADQLGHAFETIKKRLQRARSALRDCILDKLGAEAAHG